MKEYIGRIIGLLMFIFTILIFSIVDMYSNYKIFEHFIVTGSFMILFWIIGSQFDKIRLFSRELKKNREELQQVFDNIDAVLWTSERGANPQTMSKGFKNIYGYAREEFQDNPYLWNEVIYPEDRGYFNEIEKRVLSGESCRAEYRIIRSDKSIRWIQSSITPIFDHNRAVISFNGINIDITERKEIEDALVEAESKYRNLVESALVGVYIYQNERLIYTNPQLEKICGYSKEDINNMNILDFFCKGDKLFAKRFIKKLTNNTSDITEQIRIIKKDGNYADIELSGKVISYYDKLAIIGTVCDITDKKKSEEKIRQMAYHDALTGLPNRYQLNEYMQKSIARARRKGQNLAVIFIDLDRFKIINDTMGHDFGDKILMNIAHVILGCVREEDIVSRHGGDEFIILMEDISEEGAEKVCQRIIEVMSNPILINNHEVYTSPSIGISMYPKNGEDAITLIKNADAAMYLAKEKGKNTYRFYDQRLNNIATRKMIIEGGLRRAIENNEFILHYQPQIDLNTSKITGVEALVRWQHPELGVIPPMEFIPLAEETGLIIPIGKWVLKTACTQSVEWQSSGHPPINMAVNISARQMQHRDFVKTIKEVVEETGIKPELLELEITESMVKDPDELIDILNELKSIEIKISIDDFGTGYSSFSMLNHLPIDKIKIDKTFTDDLLKKNSTKALTKTIIDLGYNLNFEVIAEGIEDKEQAAFLIDSKCKMAQGYLYSKPLPAEEIKKLIEDWK
jgi:diguanylate cyclase (GGDEF)-like protein/PAS domain S-box-containing protein